MSAVHWLVRIVDRAGLLGDRRPEIAARTPTPDAWEALTRATAVSDEHLTELVAAYFRLGVADLASADPDLADILPEDLAQKHLVFPLARAGRSLVVATCDPTNLDVERSIGFTSGRSTVFEVASPGAIRDAINQRTSPEAAVETLLGAVDDEEEDAVRLIEEMGPESITEGDVQATPVVKLTNLILREGIAQGASDIHVEPGRKIGVVRYRVDGVLRKHMDLPMSALNRVVSRIKILSNLDIADRLRPQDGRARVQVKDLAYDLRISTLPAGPAEKCVIRILDSNRSFTLDDLGLPIVELERFRELLSHREGIVLVTGPTGSGKTTTLYGALRELADGAVNIMTVEDPIEYEVPAITQTQVKVKQGMTFASALRAILRQDPDIILVGEIRDRETATVAAQAAMTGHLVLATVHANDAVSAVSRLVDIGLQYGTVAATLKGALAQRLLRKVCASCAEPVQGRKTEDEARLAGMYGTEPVVRAVGCPECGFTGYRGRLPTQEVMQTSSRIQEAIEARKGPMTLQKLAVQGGMRTMHQVALEWVTEGRTTLVEVERVLGRETVEEESAEARGPSRILLVDDDEDARLMVRTLLEGEGYDVRCVEGGREALDLLAGDPDFSLVILDLTMPEIDGRQVLQRIRDSVETAAVPVLVRTGTGGDANEAELLEAGADDYLVKSASAARFLARVRAVLRRSLL